MTLEGFEFDDDDVDHVTLQERLGELDRTILRVRFESPRLSNDEILAQLTQLMEDRNALYDRLRAVRLAKFKADVRSLQLAGLQLEPVIGQATRRCSLVVRDRRLAPPDAPPGKPKKKQQWRHAWADARRDFLLRRTAEVERALGALKANKIPAPPDVIAQKRLQFELAGILAELKAE
jgi:hypothetical protein